MMKLFKKILMLAGPGILSALGFASCHVFGEEEYGTPTADFKVDLTVQDTEGHGIKGINVIPAKDYGTKALTTDDSGRAQGSFHGTIWVPANYKVYFEDPDGELNGGTFARDSAEIATSQTGKGDGHWYMGERTAKGTKVLRRE